MASLWDYDDEDVCPPEAQDTGAETPPSAIVVDDSSVEDSVPSKGSKKRGRKDSKKKHQSPGKKVAQELDLGHKHRAFRPEPQVIELDVSDDEDKLPEPSEDAAPQQQEQQEQQRPRRAVRGGSAKDKHASKAQPCKAPAAKDTAPAAAITSDAQLVQLCPQTRQMLEASRQLSAQWQELANQQDNDVEELNPAPSRLSHYHPRPLHIHPIQAELASVRAQSAVATGDGIQGVCTAGDGLVTAASTGGGADESKLVLVLKHKHGEAKVKIKLSDTVSKLLQAFLHVAQSKSDWQCPTDATVYKLEFDGTKLTPSTIIKDIDLEDGDIVDVFWK